MGLFDFLKGKKKEETKEIEIKQDSDSIKLNDIEIELPSAEKQESTIKLDLVGEDNTTAINQAVHKAIDGEEIELHTATGGKLYQETADLQQVPPLTEEEAKTIQQALTKAIEISTPKESSKQKKFHNKILKNKQKKRKKDFLQSCLLVWIKQEKIY